MRFVEGLDMLFQDLRISRVEGFTGGLLLILAPLLIYNDLSLIGFLLALVGFTFILLFLRTLSHIYGEFLIWFYARLSALFLLGGFFIAYLSGLDTVLGSPYLLGVTLMPALVNAITFASLAHLFSILAFYTLLLAGSYSFLKAFSISSTKSREWRLEIVGYSMLAASLVVSTLLLPLLSGFLLVILSIYGRLRIP